MVEEEEEGPSDAGSSISASRFFAFVLGVRFFFSVVFVFFFFFFFFTFTIFGCARMAVDSVEDDFKKI